MASVAAPSALPQTALVAGQGLIVLLVLAACVLWPRPGQPALLLTPHEPPAVAAGWARAHGLRLLGKGAIPGSLIVQPAQEGGALSALLAGRLLLAAPGGLCAPLGPAARPPLS